MVHTKKLKDLLVNTDNGLTFELNSLNKLVDLVSNDFNVYVDYPRKYKFINYHIIVDNLISHDKGSLQCMPFGNPYLKKPFVIKEATFGIPKLTLFDPLALEGYLAHEFAEVSTLLEIKILMYFLKNLPTIYKLYHGLGICGYGRFDKIAIEKGYDSSINHFYKLNTTIVKLLKEGKIITNL